MKCIVCEGEEFSGHCCLTCWTQHCPSCGKITYSEESYHPSRECLCDTHDHWTVDDRLNVKTIGYLTQVLNGIVSSFAGVFGVDLVVVALKGVLESMEGIRQTHLRMGEKLLDAKDIGARVIGHRQLHVNLPIRPDEGKKKELT